MAQISPYAAFKQANQLLEVDVDDVKVLFPTSSQAAIGTQGLNGCTCVVIIGRAILLAHISPLPHRYEDWVNRSREDLEAARRTHHGHFLWAIAGLVRRYQNDFSAASDTAWGIFADGPDGTLESTVEQIRAGLADMGFSMRRQVYREVDVQSHRPPKGELVGCFNRLGHPELYLEGLKLWPPAFPTQQQQASMVISPPLRGSNTMLASSPAEHRSRLS